MYIVQTKILIFNFTKKIFVRIKFYIFQQIKSINFPRSSNVKLTIKFLLNCVLNNFCILKRWQLILRKIVILTNEDNNNIAMDQEVYRVMLTH